MGDFMTVRTFSLTIKNNIKLQKLAEAKGEKISAFLNKIIEGL